MKDDRRYKEMLIGTIAMYAIGLFFVMIMIVMISSCSHVRFRLPDRSKCAIPWAERKDCIDERQCRPDEICAHRGRTIGKCTLIDCCEPWRSGPKLMGGYDWCTHEENQLDD